MRKRKTEEEDGGDSRFAMANCTWILMYLLAANHVRKRITRTKADDSIWAKSFQILQKLVRIAAQHCPGPLRVFQTAYGQAEMLRGRTIACVDDGSWLHSCPEGAPCSIAGAIWHWVHPGSRPRGRIAQSILPQIIIRICAGLTQWASVEEEPKTSMLVALQEGGRKTHPALLCRLQQKQKKRRTVAEWRADGLAVQPVVGSLEANTSAQFVNRIHQVFASSQVIELVLDSTRFATRDTQVCIAFASELGMAAYLPPIVNRQVKWRDCPAGSEITDADWTQFCKSGFRSKHRMEVYDTIRGIAHSLSTGMGKSLLDFSLSSELHPLSGGSARYWHPRESRWMRATKEDVKIMMSDASASGSDFKGQLELPDPAKNPPMLLLTVDQKQSQWTAAHFLADPDGLGLMVMFRGDKYRCSWRDFVLAMMHAPGYLDHTAVQVNHALNVNYAPFGSGGHMATRKEIMLDWSQLFPHAGPEFHDIVHKIGIDACMAAPTSTTEIQGLYENLVLGDQRYMNKGRFMKQSSWYSILNLISQHDRVWHAHKFMAQQVADRMGKNKAALGSIARHIVGQDVPVGPSDSGVIAGKPGDKESYLAELRKLRKKAGNAILLVPMFMSDHNLVNARIMLLVGRPAVHALCFGLMPSKRPRLLFLSFGRALPLD